MSVKTKTLDILENNKGQFISGENLAKTLDVSRNSIWKAINSLKKEGYNISSITNKGYCLNLNNNILSSESILKYLKTDFFDIEVHKTINSTNTFVKELAVNGDKEGLVVISEEQTSGRGRFSRKFYSPKGTGIYMSILLRPKLHASDSYLITSSAAVAICNAIDFISNKESKIKWVNDIYLDNKKVSGVLTEASLDFESGLIDYAVLGIGINVFKPKEGFNKEIENIATSIFDEGSEKIGDIRSELIAKILENFLEFYKNIEDKSFLEAYKEKSLLLNKEVNILSKNSTEKAIVLDIDNECRLKVKLEDGSISFLSSGEVSLKL